MLVVGVVEEELDPDEPFRPWFCVEPRPEEEFLWPRAMGLAPLWAELPELLRCPGWWVAPDPAPRRWP